MTSFPDFEAAVALFDERHFGRAARRLGITQPALTARLRRLEEEIDARLFDRGRGGVEPTAAGLAFVEQARRVLESAAHATEAARSAKSGFGLILRIGFTQIAAYQMVADCLSAFRKAHPMARLRLFEASTMQLERALEQNTIDLAFMHPPLHAPGLSQRVLHRASLVRRLGNADGASLPPIRYPRDEAPVMMGDIDRAEPPEHGTEHRVEADSAIGALTLSRAGYGPAIVTKDFPVNWDTAASDVESVGDVFLETCIAWRSLDRRPAVKALLQACR